VVDFTGKTVIITGASSGIGRACALGFARAKADVCLVDKDADGMEETCAMIKDIGVIASQHVVNVGDHAQILACVEQVIERTSKIDILINNAGINASGKIENLSEHAWDLALSVNLKSVYSFCHAVWPYLKKREASTIVNMSSVMGLVGGVDVPAYCTAKAGILMLSRCLAKDGAAYGIRVNAVCPGYIDTPILRQGYENDPNFEVLKKGVVDKQPMNRFGTADEVAKAIMFLASDDASFISGTSLTIDGALSATQIDG